jgi:large subunit ribosomal protein L5
MVIGAKSTLRGEKMYEFLDRLFNVTLPRIRDFRGLPVRGFDGRGNYTFGLKDQTTFPEIDATQVPVEKGMDITICTTGDDKMAKELLTLLGLPFAGRNKNK